MNKQCVISIQDEQTMTDDAYREPYVQPLSSDCYPHYSKQETSKHCIIHLANTVRITCIL